MEHSFTPIIKDILFRIYGENGTEIYTKNLLIQYINEKTKSASKVLNLVPVLPIFMLYML